ncbi:MAG: chromosome segregation protein SMC, partial [Gammaproteobacteria bacterium]
MKIHSLDFIAFGPFTNKSLVFKNDSGQKKGGLHIIYGANEAGKSSALRGLKALLYGIKPHSIDNFIHSHNQLRIQGQLVTDNGQKLDFIRRKGNKNTLLDSNDNTLEETILKPYLQGVSEELFNSLFGIDHQALLQGGKEILQEKGELGQTLFSAALGSKALHSVLAGLDKEASDLFLARGSKQRINSAIKHYNELKKEIAALSLSSTKWDEQRLALQKINHELASVQTQLGQNRAEINRLQRIQRVLPKLARYQQSLQTKEDLAGVHVLADDFVKRHQQIVKQLATAQTIIGQSSPRMQKLQTQLVSLTINQALLLQEEKIAHFHTRLGEYR